MNLERELGCRLKGIFKKNEPMSLHTSWKVGGNAEYFLAPADPEELSEIVRYSKDNNLTMYILGNGTNLLVKDGGLKGLTIHIGEGFNYVRREGNRLAAGAGTPMPFLARFAARSGLSGLEFAGGIPGSLGGALVMNAGAFGGYTGDLVKEVTIVDYRGERRILRPPQLKFAYRRSSLTREGIATEAVLQLEKSEPAEVESKMNLFLAERRKRHPVQPSAGSVFRNPMHQTAGKLIEAAGGKGLRVGGAQVSEEHANFIVNMGDATASDILVLIEKVRALVKEKFNIELCPEIRVVGEEN